MPFLQVKTAEQVVIRETQKHSTEAAEESEWSSGMIQLQNETIMKENINQTDCQFFKEKKEKRSEHTKV